jgi:hypothetical protein
MNLFSADIPLEDRVYLLGCSFTNQIMSYEDGFFWRFRKKFKIVNMGYPSRSNFQILEDIKELPNNSIAIIQWSSLTRPNGIPDYDKDWNAELNKIAYSSEDPLKFLINTFIKIVSQANQILNQKNIKSFQYLGWLQWLNSEIDDETESQLNKLPINWFTSPEVIDIMKCNCWEYNPYSISIKLKYPLHGQERWVWKSTKWGGMSEWIRANVPDVYDRYLAVYEIQGYNDPHPSKYGSELFYKKIIVPALKQLIKEKNESN